MEDYLTRYMKQRGACKLCGKSKPLFELDVDHNHRTGKVRGLLCRGCNHGIGWLGDTLDKLERAMHYLRENDSDIT